ncbi:MAG: MFS transporter [Planctomycetaceae bacterium]
MERAANESPSLPTGKLRSAGYVGLLLTQFFGAFNDNMFRWLAVPIGQRVMKGENADTLALVLGGVCFTLPYLLLVATAGSLADRYPNRSVIVGCKIAEIASMLLGAAAVVSLNPLYLFATVTLLGAQSALFGPAKFGSLPEMLHPTQLSKGNGVMGLATVVASALGMVAGFQLFAILDQARPVCRRWTTECSACGHSDDRRGGRRDNDQPAGGAIAGRIADLTSAREPVPRDGSCTADVAGRTAAAAGGARDCVLLVPGVAGAAEY